MHGGLSYPAGALLVSWGRDAYSGNSTGDSRKKGTNSKAMQEEPEVIIDR